MTSMNFRRTLVCAAVATTLGVLAEPATAAPFRGTFDPADFAGEYIINVNPTCLLTSGWHANAGICAATLLSAYADVVSSSPNPAYTGRLTFAPPNISSSLQLFGIYVVGGQIDSFDTALLPQTGEAPGTPDDGLFLRNADGQPQMLATDGTLIDGLAGGLDQVLFGEHPLGDGRRARTVLAIAADRYLGDEYAPESVEGRCGIPAPTIRRIAREMAEVAFSHAIELPIAWTDVWGREHDKVVGRPVAMYAMRGISAHSNGFQTCRALHLLQMLLGALEGPGNFRARAPYPKPIPPHQVPSSTCAPDTPLPRPPLGFPMRPEDLALDADGRPLRIDKAYTWEAPLAAHGMLQMVIANAVAGDPYPIDTLLLFMANMAWNSAMNTGGTRDMLCAKDDAGD